MFTHGTTLGLNALLTRTGARTAVIATRGFRDVYLLGRTDRRVNYDITYRKPAAAARTLRHHSRWPSAADSTGPYTHPSTWRTPHASRSRWRPAVTRPLPLPSCMHTRTRSMRGSCARSSSSTHQMWQSLCPTSCLGSQYERTSAVIDAYMTLSSAPTWRPSNCASRSGLRRQVPSHDSLRRRGHDRKGCQK